MMTGPADSGDRPEKLFALPLSTSFRFPLLILATIASSIFVYDVIYHNTPLERPAIAQMRTCASLALSQDLSGTGTYSTQLQACQSSAEQAAASWILVGIGVLTLTAAALYYGQPWWYRRRRRLDKLTAPDTAALVIRLESLRRRVGVRPVTWLWQPLNDHVTAFAFGTFQRRFVAITGGAVVVSARQPASFDAVILHELAHFKNRDVTQTYLAVAIWRAFVVAVLLPLAGVLLLGHAPISAPRLAWRVALLALVVYLLRNSILRSREFDADARVLEFEPDSVLGTVLTGLPPRRHRFWQLGWSHPSGQARAQALRDPRPLYRTGFWDGLAIGVAATAGAASMDTIFTLLGAASFTGILLSTGIFALFSGPAVAVVIWRQQFLAPETATPRGWAVGCGLGVGAAIGPIIELSGVLDSGLAPDSLQPGALGVLVAWISLVTVVFLPFPVWTGYWADVWQRPTKGSTSRVPARSGLLATSAAASVVLAISLWLLLRYDSLIQLFDESTEQTLSQSWTFTGFYLAQQPAIWIVCCVVTIVPLLGCLTGRRNPWPGDPRDRARMLPIVRQMTLWCSAGALAAIALVLAVDAAAHADIPAPIRWSRSFAGNLAMWADQAVIGVAVLFALLAAARIKSRQAIPLALVIAVAVDVIGTPVAVNPVGIGSCFAPLSVVYTHPPASQCLHFTSGSFILQETAYGAIEAILACIILLPAAHYAGTTLARYQAGRKSASEIRALQRIAVGATVITLLAGTAWRISDASAHGIVSAGSIGQDGWISGPGYHFRLYPPWYERTSAENQFTLISPLDESQLTIQSTGGYWSANAGNPPCKGERHPAVFDQIQGLDCGPFIVGDQVLEEWLVAKGAYHYTVTLIETTAHRSSLQHSVAAMLSSWQWGTIRLRHYTRSNMSHRYMRIAFVVIIISIASGCSAGGSASTSASSATCADQLLAWDNHGGSSRVDAIGADARKDAQANNLLLAALSSGIGLTAAESGIEAAATAIRTDTAAAAADLPPVCVPRLRADVAAMLTEYAKTAADFDSAMTEIRDKNYSLAQQDFAAATELVKAANTRFAAASLDLAQFTKSQVRA